MHHWTNVPFAEPTCSELDLFDTFSDSVCVLLNRPITVLRLIGFSKKKSKMFSVDYEIFHAKERYS